MISVCALGDKNHDRVTFSSVKESRAWKKVDSFGQRSRPKARGNGRSGHTLPLSSKEGAAASQDPHRAQLWDGRLACPLGLAHTLFDGF